MNITSFLEHYGIVRNPFAEEDAQTDPVFKEHCISSAYHPVWDKVYGDPSEPSTAIVFGPKGSGKTAMRLQIHHYLKQFNRERPTRRVFVIRYDDFNPFLDHFRERLSRRTSKKPEKVLEAWRLWDHMDGILCLGVTRLVDQVIGRSGEDVAESDGTSAEAHRLRPDDVAALDRTSARDLLLLACCYDQSTASTFTGRWRQLRRTLGYHNWSVHWDQVLAVVWTIAMIVLVGGLWWGEHISTRISLWLLPILVLLGVAPYALRWFRCHWLARGVRRHMRVGKREVGSLRKVLLQIPPKELASQPLPRFDRTDDRYELLQKFQLLIHQLGFSGIIVLVDRVDEPHLTGGRSDLMRRFVWPLLDNKLLKHPGLGFKLMLPQELYRDTERETREFHERARLDKQNVIPAFSWSGESLYDLAQARMRACSTDNRTVEPKDLFADSVSYQRMLDVFQSLRVPRHLFRFLYRVLVEHCNKHTDADAQFKVSSETFESVLAVYTREMDAAAS